MKRCFFLFLIGGAGYSLLEILWRGYTHPSMTVLGGICFAAMDFMNRKFCHRALVFRAVCCAGFITFAEFLSGLLLNRYLKLGVWDYSGMKYNLLGQISLLYSVLWFCLSYLLLFVLDRIAKKQKI